MKLTAVQQDVMVAALATGGEILGAKGVTLDSLEKKGLAEARRSCPEAPVTFFLTKEGEEDAHALIVATLARNIAAAEEETLPEVAQDAAAYLSVVAWNPDQTISRFDSPFYLGAYDTFMTALTAAFPDLAAHDIYQAWLESGEEELSHVVPTMRRNRELEAVSIPTILTTAPVMSECIVARRPTGRSSWRKPSKCTHGARSRRAANRAR